MVQLTSFGEAIADGVRWSPDGREIAFAVQEEMKASPMVDPKLTTLDGNFSPDDANGTFTFTVKVTPLNLPKFDATGASAPAP